MAPALSMKASMMERCPLPKRLDILLISYSIHVITALITLPTLIWHISSTHIHDDYDMPDDWTEEFNKAQFTGGRGLLWGFLFVLIPVDCLHSLIALDYFHGLRYGRGHASYKPTEDQKPRHRPCSFSPIYDLDSHYIDQSDSFSESATIRKTVPLPTHPTRTYHPLLTAHLPPAARLSLLTLYDIALSTFLAVHITMFFSLLGVNWVACDDYNPLWPENFLDLANPSMTVLERCHKINTDMYVSGGFDVALCCVLLVIHLWHLAFRAWDVLVSGVQKEAEIPVKQQPTNLDGTAETPCSMELQDLEGRGRTTARIFCDLSAQGNTRKMRDGTGNLFKAHEDTPEVPDRIGWNEVLLECLVH